MAKYHQTLGKVLHIDELNVKKKLRLLTIFFLCMLSVMVLYTSITLNQQKNDGLVVNIAGRQRMLTQKFTKEFFLALQQGKTNSNLMEKTGKLFDISLKALNKGGETFQDLGMTKPVILAGTSSEIIQKQLAKVSFLWQQLQNSISKMDVKKSNQNQLLDINQLGVNVLKTMNKAVGMFANEADNKVLTLQIMLLILWFFSIIISLSIASVIVTSVTNPIDSIVQVSKKLATGDMIAENQTEKMYGEMSILLINMNIMRDSLSNIIKTMQQNIQQMLYSSKQISDVSTEIFESNIQEQESSKQVLEATKSLQQISETVSKQINTAKEDVELTKKHAQQGIVIINQNIEELTNTVESVNVTANQMEMLKKATVQIHRIIESIQEIADQTNLLALNATIEAARAGDAGKGFAVVASEIKELAKQTTNSASEISDLINDLTTQVDNSVDSMQQVVNKVNISQKQSEKTVVAFEDMTHDVGRTMEATNTISDYNQEQTVQLEHLNEQLNSFFSVLSQSAQKADNIVMVATSLSSVTDNLDTSLKKFIVTDTDNSENKAPRGKRQFPRIDNNIRCRLKQGNNVVNGLSGNISQHGLLVKCTKKLNHNEDMPLQLILPENKTDWNQSKDLSVLVKIKREFIEDGFYHYGVNFDKKNPEITKIMKDVFKYFKKQINYAE